MADGVKAFYMLCSPLKRTFIQRLTAAFFICSVKLIILACCPGKVFEYAEAHSWIHSGGFVWLIVFVNADPQLEHLCTASVFRGANWVVVLSSKHFSGLLLRRRTRGKGPGLEPWTAFGLCIWDDCSSSPLCLFSIEYVVAFFLCFMAEVQLDMKRWGEGIMYTAEDSWGSVMFSAS